MARKKEGLGAVADRRRQLIERILRNVRVDEDTGCWLWIRRLNNGGYPVITMRVDGRGHPVPLFAHRVALELFKGPPGRRMEAAHDILCPYRHCVHPEHLRWATRKENCADQRHPSRLHHIRTVPLPLHTIERAFA